MTSPSAPRSASAAQPASERSRSPRPAAGRALSGCHNALDWLDGSRGSPLGAAGPLRCEHSAVVGATRNSPSDSPPGPGTSERSDTRSDASRCRRTLPRLLGKVRRGFFQEVPLLLHQLQLAAQPVDLLVLATALAVTGKGIAVGEPHAPARFFHPAAHNVGPDAELPRHLRHRTLAFHDQAN